MKNKFNWYPVLLLMCIAMIQCTKSDDYKKYLSEGTDDGSMGEIIYPQKADFKTYPGRNRILLEWVIIDPKVTKCVITYEQAGNIQDTIVPIEPRSDFSNDTIRVMINNLEETMYMFKIVTYDDFGHASIPVEAEEMSYGEVYERFLLNRGVKSMVYDLKYGFLINWQSAADNSEVCIILNYTKNNSDFATEIITSKETFKSIPDFDFNVPISYCTLYKPAPSAIDTFYAPVVVRKIDYVPYWSNITAEYLENTDYPFVADLNKPGLIANRYYPALGWTCTGTTVGYGNVDTGSVRRNTLCFLSWYDGSNSVLCQNAKLFQTIELDAGKYKFDVWVHESTSSYNGGQGRAYITVAAGNSLPDITRVEQDALIFSAITPGLSSTGTSPNWTNSGTLFSREFTLTVKSTVSLGINVNFPTNAQTQVHFRRFVLYEWR